MSMTSICNRRQRLNKLSCHTIRNMTTDTDLQGNFNESPLLIVDPLNAAELNIGDVLRTINGTVMVIENLGYEAGLSTFTTKSVHNFGTLYRSQPTPPDSFGRSSDSLQLIIDELPLVVHSVNGSEYVYICAASNDIRQGDIIHNKGSDHHVVAVRTFQGLQQVVTQQ